VVIVFLVGGVRSIVLFLGFHWRLPCVRALVGSVAFGLAVGGGCGGFGVSGYSWGSGYITVLALGLVSVGGAVVLRGSWCWAGSWSSDFGACVWISRLGLRCMGLARCLCPPACSSVSFLALSCRCELFRVRSWPEVPSQGCGWCCSPSCFSLSGCPLFCWRGSASPVYRLGDNGSVALLHWV